ncbi:MAG: Ldh family oxidoreductase [Planctomycetes bacterium]|nr:Ldh family oxidoreductase [Planctomycetota bacterium]
MIKKTAQELDRAVRRIVEAVGTPPENAARVAHILVGAHLAGHDSHGIQHLPRYIREVRAGDIVPAGQPEVLRESGPVVLVRGRWGWGHVTAEFATQRGIEKARRFGMGLVGAVEVNHIGRLGHYAEQAAEQGVVILLSAGFKALTAPTAAPHGGRKALLAPNPIAMGFPSTPGAPVILDFATTQVAGGKVALAKAKGETLPPGCIIDREGRPSVRPDDYFEGGALLPFGGHKGFGIMVATEILGQILPGADAFSETPHGGVHYRHAGLSLVAIDSGVFSSRHEFASRTERLVERIHGVPPAPGVHEVLAPGDFEHRARSLRAQQGIDVPETTWKEILETAESLGVGSVMPS